MGYRRIKLIGTSGFCIWLTGLSGSGKSTIANALESFLESEILVEILDGDILRKGLSADLQFSKADRNTNITRAFFISRLLARNKVAVICAFISPYRKVRSEGKRTINNFIEVFVKCPLSVCEERDPKGLYKKVRKGLIKNFTGIDDPYEEPERPDIIVDTEKDSVTECVKKICIFLYDRDLIVKKYD